METDYDAGVGSRWAMAAACVAAGGCAAPPAGFDSPLPHGRQEAAVSAARVRDASSVPELIRMLGSDDPGERLVAIRTLERLTGTDRGYDHAASEAARREAVRRWETWYASTGAGVPGEAGGPAPTASENADP